MIDICLYDAVSGYQVQGLYLFLRNLNLKNNVYDFSFKIVKVEEEEKYLMNFFFLRLMHLKVNESQYCIIFGQRIYQKAFVN